MSKSNKTAKSNKNTAATVQRGPGRPKYVMTFPAKKQWTFADLCEANGVNPDTLKGKQCTGLTLRKNMDRDMFMTDEKTGKPDKTRARRNSAIVLIKGEFAEPDSKDGLGRKPFLYSLRAKLNGTKPLAKTARKSTVSVNVGTAPAESTTPTADALEATKAALLTPTPVVDIAPVEDSAPAPEAVAAETAAVAETATAEAAAPANA